MPPRVTIFTCPRVRAAVFRAVGVGGDLEFLNGVDGRLERIAAHVGIVVIHAVEQKIIGFFAASIGVHGEPAASGELGTLHGRSHTRQEQGELQKIALIERQAVDQGLVEHRAQFARLGGQGRGFGAHHHLRLLARDPHPQIEPYLLIHLDANGPRGEGRERIGRYREEVRGWRQTVKFVIAGGVTVAGPLPGARSVFDLDGGVRNGAFRGVQNVTRYAARVHLGHEPETRQKEHGAASSQPRQLSYSHVEAKVPETPEYSIGTERPVRGGSAW